MVMQRVFAHKIIYCGKEYRNHVAELSDKGAVKLFPFECEIAMTLFYSGAIEITLNPQENKLEVTEIRG